MSTLDNIVQPQASSNDLEATARLYLRYRLQNIAHFSQIHLPLSHAAE
jgi:hypothetical protein